MSLYLRIGVAAYCLAQGIDALQNEPLVFAFLFSYYGMDWSSTTAQNIVDITIWLMIAGAPLVFLRRCTPLCAIACLWALVELTTLMIARQRFFELCPLTMALQVLTPVALILAWRGRSTAAAWCLRLAASATFVGHGIESIQGKPEFIDYLLVTSKKFGLGISETGATETLIVIGGADLIAASLLLFRPFRGVLYYMIAWGLITALARVFHSEWLGATDCLLRTVHWIGPLALLLHVRLIRSVDRNQAAQPG